MRPRTLAIVIVLGVLGVSLAFSAAAQPKAEIRLPEKIDPVEAAKKGQALVADLLSQQPEADSSTTAMLTVRPRQGSVTQTAVHFSVQVTDTNTISRYVAEGTNGETLIIHQRSGQPNEYFLGSGPNSEVQRLDRQQVMKPFASSDFWIADLGLEFLHWPTQKVIKHEMRRGQSCEVLESLLPNALPGGYARVVSWIAADKPGVMLVRADAYDAEGKLLKQFEPKKLQKVNGQYQLKEMEMQNRETGSRTTIAFDFNG